MFRRKLLLFVASASLFVIGFKLTHPPAVAQILNCKKTESGPKCGVDLVLSTSPCGSGTCVTMEERYGNITNCAGGGQGGLSHCSAGNCQKFVIVRECMGGACSHVSTTATNAAPLSFASGSACGGGPTTQQSEPLEEEDPPEPTDP